MNIYIIIPRNKALMSDRSEGRSISQIESNVILLTDFEYISQDIVLYFLNFIKR